MDKKTIKPIHTKYAKTKEVKDKVSPKLQKIQHNQAYTVGKIKSTKQKPKFLWGPEYDLIEVSKLRDIETYFSRSIRKKLDVIFKEGYKLTSKNARVQKKLVEKLMEMEYVSGISFELLLYRIVENLIVFDNAIVAKIRNKKSTSFKAAKMSKKKTQPIAAFKLLPIEYVYIETDEEGNVLNYYVLVQDQIVETYPAEDIIHITRNKKSGFLFGTPEVIPVIDDILELRRIEENVTQTIYRTATPLMVITVGTESAPAKVIDSEGRTELDLVREIIENTEPGSAIILPERHKVDIIGSKSEALNVSDYLSHFKKRVFAGLSMSAYDFGETDSANRGSAAGLSKDFIDYCKGIQRYINIFIKMMFREIVAEFTNLVRAYDSNYEIYIEWNEIDPDRKTKHENATVQLYTSNIITIQEARERLGFDPENFEQEYLFTSITSQVRLNEESAKSESESQLNPENQHTQDFKLSPSNLKFDIASCLYDEEKFNDLILEICDTYNIDFSDGERIVINATNKAYKHKQMELINYYFNYYLEQGVKNAKEDK